MPYLPKLWPLSRNNGALGYLELGEKQMSDDYYESIEIVYPKKGKHEKKSQRRKKVKHARKVYHVVCAKVKKGSGNTPKHVWKVKLAGKSTVANGVFAKKNDAIARAKELGKKAKLGQVVIHGIDGKIQTEYTYGDDPRDIKG